MSSNVVPLYMHFRYKVSSCRLRFEGIRGKEYAGDIALDDIWISGCDTTTFCHSETYACASSNAPRCLTSDWVCDFITDCADDEQRCGEWNLLN